MSIRDGGRALNWWRVGMTSGRVRGESVRKGEQVRYRKRRDRSPELAEDGVEALDDFMRSNRFNAIQGNE